MKKVAILTINDDTNYGNRLQNYAVQEFLKQYDVDCYTIQNKIGQYGIHIYIQQIKDIIKKIIKKDSDTKKYLNFKKFNKKYINYSNIRIDKNHIPRDLYKKFDTFIVGSDQVWNPTFGRMSDIDFLTFVPKNKRNAFSASFGINKIPDNLSEYYKSRLEKFANISVREDRAKDIIQELTGRKDVEVILDPTMLLTGEDWSKIAKKPKQLKTDKFVLNYFLGELSEKRKNEINRVAEENGYEVINILDKNSPFYQIGPSEYLYLEKNAFLICTDSFHSTVFAILFNRPFIVFDREDNEVKMNSRLETLLKKFHFEDRWYRNTITKEMLQIDYSNTYKILKREREKANNYIATIWRENGRK